MYNFFSLQVRAREGANDHPEALDFLYRWRCRIFIATSIFNFSKYSNCQQDGDKPLIPLDILNVRKEKEKEEDVAVCYCF